MFSFQYSLYKYIYYFIVHDISFEQNFDKTQMTTINYNIYIYDYE